MSDNSSCSLLACCSSLLCAACYPPSGVHCLQAVKVATALNWQTFCGCIAAAAPEPGSFDPLRYNASFAKEFDAVKQFALPYVKQFKVCGAIRNLSRG